jgi:RimJ/RimL family protein N-acetyltransferase
MNPAADFTGLRTPRLVLRRLRPDDARAVCTYRSLPEVARYQSWETFSLADAEELIATQAAVVPDTPGTWLQLAITRTASGELIGDCGLHFRADDHQQAELGITMSPDHQGQGFATEALRRVLDYLFGELGKHRVTAVTDTENMAAATLFLRLGFRREAHHVENVWFKGAWGSEFVFALLRREWESLPPA